MTELPVLGTMEQLMERFRKTVGTDTERVQQVQADLQKEAEAARAVQKSDTDLLLKKADTEAAVIIQFSTCAPPTFWEKVKAKSPFDPSKMICMLTHSPFSHGDLMLANGNLLGASNNPGAPYEEGNPCGVAIRPPNYQHFAIRRRAVIPTTAAKAQVFEDYCRAQLGKPFDTEALKMKTFLSGSFANRDWRKDDKWFCIEMLARASEISKVIPWKIIGIKNRITASDYLLMINPLIDVDLFWEPIVGMERGYREL